MAPRPSEVGYVAPTMSPAAGTPAVPARSPASATAPAGVSAPAPASAPGAPGAPTPAPAYVKPATGTPANSGGPNEAIVWAVCLFVGLLLGGLAALIAG
jgi:hypothetical protein